MSAFKPVIGNPTDPELQQLIIEYNNLIASKQDYLNSRCGIASSLEEKINATRAWHSECNQLLNEIKLYGG